MNDAAQQEADGTAPEESRYTDTQLDLSVAAMLRIGLTVSSLIVLAGGLWELRHPMRALPDYTHFRAVEPALRSVPGTFLAALRPVAGQSRAIIQVGLLLLIATPIARVGLCAVGFARQRSWLYVGISLLVLGVLVWSVAGAFHRA